MLRRDRLSFFSEEFKKSIGQNDDPARCLVFLRDNRPDLILLDVHMPDIPVIFLTADDDSNMETRGLEAGAKNFIKKPFVPEVLLLRQQEKLERISMQIVTALSGAIDAKDTYTNGHSTRVAEYSREIAKRAGFAAKERSQKRFRFLSKSTLSVRRFSFIRFLHDG